MGEGYGSNGILTPLAGGGAFRNVMAILTLIYLIGWQVYPSSCCDLCANVGRFACIASYFRLCDWTLQLFECEL